MASEPPRDDRILTLTRAVAVVVSLILALAWVVLFLTPATDRRFAWTIAGTMTPMLMGAGYGSALVFFAAVTGGRRWHRVTLGFIPTTVFAWMMLGTTLLHWDRFRHGSAAF